MEAKILAAGLDPDADKLVAVDAGLYSVSILSLSKLRLEDVKGIL